MKLIPLTQGQFAKIDDEDFYRVALKKWMYHPSGYAYRTEWNCGNKRHIFMHNQILGVKRGADHIDGDGLNNQRSNLRPSNKSQNGANRGRQSNGKTGYKGVTFNPNPYQAQIWRQGKRYRLGSFPQARYAAYAYDFAARDLFGEFAQLNFPDALGSTSSS